MAVVILRPVGTWSADDWALNGAAATKHGALSDDVDGNYLHATGTRYGEFELNPPGGSAYTLAAGERVKQVRVRARGRYTGNLAPKLNFRYGTWIDELTYATPDLVTLTGAWVTYTGAWRAELISSSSINGIQVTQQNVLDELHVAIDNPDFAGGETTRIASVTELYVDLDVWQRTAAPTVSAPSGVVSDTDTPDVTWAVATLNDGAPSTWARQVRVFRDEVYLAVGFDPATETDVEWETLQTAHAGHDGTVAIGTPLDNADTYRAYVRVGKEGVAGQTLWSTWGNSEWTQDLASPAAPGLEVVVDQVEGRQQLTLTPAALTYDTLEHVEVQRSDDGGATWATVRDGTMTDVAASTPTTIHDHDAPRDTGLTYRARTVEGVTASGSTVTSAWTTSATVVHPLDGRWWFYDVGDWTRVRGGMRVVELPEFELDQDVGVFRPPGRRTAVVVSGTLHGYDGGFELRSTGAEEVAAVDALVEWTGTVLVKSPFGWQRYVRWIERGMVLAGTPGQPRHGWTVAYVEVDDGIGA